MDKQDLVQIRKLLKDSERVHEAWLNLYHTLHFRAPLPLKNPYMASPELLVLLVNLIHEHKPRMILELGSGLSSIILGYALEQLQGSDARRACFLTVDHDLHHVQKTVDMVKLHGLGDVVRAIHAPLSPVRTPLKDNRFWYNLSVYQHILVDIDFLVVDGPPGHMGSMMRYPAVPNLNLKHGAIIVVDDTYRSDERKMIDEWMSLSNFEREDYDIEKGVTVLQLIK
jgi:predicted O-methyltransferase YrrM